MTAQTQWRRGHRSGQHRSSAAALAGTTGSSSVSMSAGLGLSGQINMNVARDAALNNAYSELGKELFNPNLKTVGNYSLGKEIGEGTFGSVRMGLHRLTNSRVAIKQISRSSAPGSLTREIHHHRQLHHPHVCQLLEIVATESSIYLVSELCAGGELYDYLVECGRLAEHEARRIIGQLLLALGYCHAQGVCHRDLKLENVLLNEACDVKLADFGFGREFDKQRLLETFCGTTGYAAPEMLAGHRYRAQEVDIWSVGVILYALLTGSLPFDDDDEAVMKQKIVTLDLDLPLWLPEEPRDLLSKILVLDPSARPNISQILAHPWFKKQIAPFGPLSEAMQQSSSHQGFEGGQPAIPEEESSEAVTPATAVSRPAHDKEVSADTFMTALSASSITAKNGYHDTYATNLPPATPQRSYEPSPRPSLDETERMSRSPHPLSRTSSGHSQVLPHARTPSRTKRRSISSLHTLSERMPPHLAPTVDYLAQLGHTGKDEFESKTDKKLLDLMDALGLDTGQVKHSVRHNACDSSGAMWWFLKRKHEAKVAPVHQPVLKHPRPSQSPSPVVNSTDIPSLDVPEPEVGYSFPTTRPRNRPRSNSALPSAPSSPVSPAVSPILPSTSVPNLVQSASESKTASQTGLGLGQPDASPTISSNTLPVQGKPRSASVSILQRATSAITGSSGVSSGEKSRETSTNEQTGRATPLGILFGRKGSSSGDPPTAPSSPSKEERLHNQQQQRSADTGSETEMINGDSPVLPSESSHEARNSSRHSLGTSPASSAGPSQPSTAVGSSKARSGRLLSTFKFFFNDDRRRRKRNTAPALSNFEGSSVAKFRVAPAVASNVKESPLRKAALNSTSSSASALHMEAPPVHSSRRSSVSSMHHPKHNGPGHRRTRSDSSRQSFVSKHEPESSEQSRPASVASIEALAPLSPSASRRQSISGTKTRHKRSYSQSSGNSRGSDHIAFRRAPTTATQVRRIKPSHYRRRDSASSSIRSYSSRSSLSETEFEGSPAPLAKDEPVIEEEENEMEDRELERERAFHRLSNAAPTDTLHHGRERAGSGTIFTAHKSTSVFHSPASSRGGPSFASVGPATGPLPSKGKVRNVFASKKSGGDGDDEWEDTFEGYSTGFGQANSGHPSGFTNGGSAAASSSSSSEAPMLGAGRYAGVVDESMPRGGGGGAGVKSKGGGYKGMAITVEEEEEE